MYRTMFHQRIPASRRLRMLAAAAIAVLALSACGGGVGSSGSGVGNSGSGVGNSGSGGGNSDGGGGATSTLGRSPSAGGVTAEINHTGVSQNIRIAKGDYLWMHDPSTAQPPPTGWIAETKLNAPAATATELFRAVGTIPSAGNEDYLLYGYWNRLPLDSLGDYEPFYYGGTPYTGNVREQTGAASYTGGATGVYQTDTSPGATAVAGRFTADVEISVNFGNETEDGGLQLGMSNIATLTSAGAAGPTLDDIRSTLTADVEGSGFTGDGPNNGSRWGGQFYGPSDGVPTGLAGWFEGILARSSDDSGVAFLSGTFGAKKQ